MRLDFWDLVIVAMIVAGALVGVGVLHVEVQGVGGSLLLLYAFHLMLERRVDRMEDREEAARRRC